ncbi:MAG: Lrp/AsnC family transcriptional regulator [Thaumarchaeota archaeon]|nr:MAG: Lrp/AsnC family transcriptional regulator [Nitrososphaerota archaeon]
MKRHNIYQLCNCFMSQILEDVKKSGRERVYVMINCEDGSMQYVIDQLKFISGITEIQSTIGPYDIVTKIDAQSIMALREIITVHIRRVPKVRTTTTIVCEHTSLL